MSALLIVTNNIYNMIKFVNLSLFSLILILIVKDVHHWDFFTCARARIPLWDVWNNSIFLFWWWKDELFDYMWGFIFTKTST